MRKVDILKEFSPLRFMNEYNCRRFIAEQTHEGEIVCPACGLPCLDINRLYSGRFVKCKCGKRYNWATGTEFSAMKISCSTLVMLMLLYETNMPDTNIAKILGIDRETVRLWRMRLKDEL